MPCRPGAAREFRTMTAMTATPMPANNPLVRMDAARAFDPVRARVHVEPLTTNAERLQAVEAACTQTSQRRAPLGINALRDTRFGRYIENMHPGDIVYWVACLGGACLLLIKATI